jgi:HTH-type transcriptional regulator/antitoxin HigA
MPNTTASTPRPSRAVEIIPIRSDEDLDRALREIDALMDLEHPSDSDEDRLEILAILAGAYEEKRHPIPPPNAIDAIRFRLDQLGFHTPGAQAAALAGVLGSRSRVYEVLQGKRGLSSSMVTRLWRRFDVPLESLVRGMTVRKNTARHRRPRQGKTRTGSS